MVEETAIDAPIMIDQAIIKKVSMARTSQKTTTVEIAYTVTITVEVVVSRINVITKKKETPIMMRKKKLLTGVEAHKMPSNSNPVITNNQTVTDTNSPR